MTFRPHLTVIALLAAADPPTGGSQLILSGRSYPSRVVMIHTGQQRDLSPAAKRIIHGYATSFLHDSTFGRRFTHEYLFREGTTDWWIPIQTVLEEPLQNEVPVGSRVTLLTRWAGTERIDNRLTWVFVANEFEAGGVPTPPSQYELNGFLLGQTVETIERPLGKPFQDQATPDGWRQRVYGLERAKNSYMVFQSDSVDPLHVFAIQMAGEPGARMRRFLGLTLGDSRARVDSLLGRPSHVKRETDVAVDLLSYEGTNYTVEIDSTGVLSSIMIYGFEGFVDTPDTTDPLGRFTRALRRWDVDSLMRVVAGDIEVFRDTSLISWTYAPRTELSDSTLPISRELRKVAAAIDGRTPVSAVRLTESGNVGLVYTYAAGPVKELFFVWRPGGHRLYEVILR